MKRQYIIALAAALLAAPASYAQFAATGTTTLSVTVSADGCFQFDGALVRCYGLQFLVQI